MQAQDDDDCYFAQKTSGSTSFPHLVNQIQDVSPLPGCDNNDQTLVLKHIDDVSTKLLPVPVD